MAGIKGRSGAHKVADQENNYKVLAELFFGKINTKKVSRKIESGKFTALDMMKHKLGTGDRETLLKLFTKLFPDSVIADIHSKVDFEGIKLDR